ncbi:PilW family protein [Clostridium beijerinckii]|uniref:Prepilin-type N-terminal cleavage/methylation domain-containing protein n=1 Tax=Clostridium beijerinckii TaxID=1520 RepID=A0AAW3WAF0_CLOBE|nr:prepilin-type N-terminal cleavage/methylation domain-containing protein [Clostridium beijerinckii]MBC2455831.1 prepilin-type N-terminal cleavage/methylation domain-containing protein [Clostridium beijerinckii]MBC2475886.1 prepilin-type N-terminal cleavage/methylation domain-containing protein [Clostridium beijerinckii]MDG5852948.1 prepilin-type N-terminal cleavage/methylation domain-containing protein [Clostridium beijerinckii]NOV61781.1 prepilin-type N-terminal cleavage/methylation domain-c
MKKKKSGFTLIEVIIVLVLTVIVLGIICSIFITGNKVFSDSDVKSTLQMEAKNMQEELTQIGIQGISVTDIEINGASRNADGQYVDKKYSEIDSSKINRIEIQGYDKDSVYSNDGTVSNEKYYNIIYNEDGKLKLVYDNGDSKILSENVNSFRIVPQDKNKSFAESSSIEFDIILSEKKSYSNVKYPISINVSFRNRGD